MHSIINPHNIYNWKYSYFLNLIAVTIAGHVLFHVSRMTDMKTEVVWEMWSNKMVVSGAVKC